MEPISRATYWQNLTPTRKTLLLLGLTIMSPVLVILLLVAGANEAFKFITTTKI